MKKVNQKCRYTFLNFELFVETQNIQGGIKKGGIKFSKFGGGIKRGGIKKWEAIKKLCLNCRYTFVNFNFFFETQKQSRWHKKG